MLLPLERIRKKLLENIPQGINSKNGEKVIKSGTTAFAFYYKDGVIVAADSRTSLGSSIFRHDSSKISKISRFSLLTAAGTVAYIQYMKDELVQFINQFTIESDGKFLTLDGQARLFKEILRIISIVIPLESIFVLAGYDTRLNRFKIYEFDELGGWYEVSVKQKFASVGSGGEIASSILKSSLDRNPNPDLNTAIKIAMEALTQSAHQDTFSEPPSLNKPMIFKINKDGYKILSNPKEQKD